MDTLTPSAFEHYEDACRFVDGLDVSTMKLGLARVEALLKALNNPQDSLPMVHIAGTNGKGSVAAMLSSILKSASLSVGTFTSPHLIHIRERIAMNGNAILPDDFAYEASLLKNKLETLGWPHEDWPTYFEFLNVMAYQYFKRKNADITVVETGLGGRLDSTNIVKHPNLSVITHIGMDHMAHLGDTLGQIAAEKAGILKSGTPLVLGPNLPKEAHEVILQRADALGVPAFVAESMSMTTQPKGSTRQRVTLSGGMHYTLGLAGSYQADNLATVLECVRQLRLQGFEISEAAVVEGLKQAHWPARFQVFPEQRLVVDGSHNIAGFTTLVESLQQRFKGQPLSLMLSLRANRDARDVLRPLATLSGVTRIILTTGAPEALYHNPEALEEAVASIFGADTPVELCPEPDAALKRLQAELQQQPDAVGVVTGSLYTAGAVLAVL